MRLFVAINLPDPVRACVHEAAAPMRDGTYPVRWVDPAHYHLTIKFLGQIHADRVGAVTEALDRVAAGTAPFEVEIGGFGAFPTVRRPRVLWVGLDATPALRCLKQDVEWGLSKLGLERETRAFQPHVTLGRVRGADGAGTFRGIDELVPKLQCVGRVPVDRLDLMESVLGKQGPRYRIVSSSELNEDL